MAQVFISDLLYGVEVDPKKVDALLKTLRNIGDLSAKAMGGDGSPELAKDLAAAQKAAENLTRSLTPLEKAASAYEGELRNLDKIQKSGAITALEAAKRYGDIEKSLEQSLGAADKSAVGFADLAKVQERAAASALDMERAARSSGDAYDPARLRTYTEALSKITAEEKAGIASKSASASSLRDLVSQMDKYRGSLADGSAEQRDVTKAMGETSQAAARLEGEVESAANAFKADEIRKFTAELKTIEAAGRTGGASLEQTGKSLEQLEGRLRDFGSATSLTSKEQLDLARVMEATSKASQGLATQADKASKAFQITEISRYNTELKALEAANKSGAASFEQTEQGIRAVLSEMKAFGGTLQAGSKEARELGASVETAEKSLDGLRASQEKAGQAFRTDTLKSYRAELNQIESAQRSGASSFEQTAKALGSLEDRLRETGQAFEAAGGDTKELDGLLAKVQGSTESLAGAQTKAQAAYKSTEIRAFATELKAIEAAQRSGATSAEQAGKAVDDLQKRMRDYAAGAELAEREQTALEKVMRESSSSAQKLSQDVEKATNAYKADEIRKFATELKAIEAAQKSGATSAEQTARAIESLQAEMKEYGSAAGLAGKEQKLLDGVIRDSESATKSLATAVEKAAGAYKADQLRSFRTELEQIESANKSGVSSYDQTGKALTALEGKMREFGASAGLSEKETATLTGTLIKVEGATKTLAAAQEKARSAYELKEVQAYKQELVQIEAAYKSGAISTEAARGRIVLLQQAMREYGSSLEQGSNAQQELAKAMGTTEGAAQKLEQSARKADEAMQGKNVDRLITSLRDLQLAYERGDIEQEEFIASAKNIEAALDAGRNAVDQNSTAYGKYTQALTQTNSAIVRAEGGFTKFSKTGAATAAIGDQLSGALYRLGPAGEAIGVVLSNSGIGAAAAGTGMTKAAVAAKLLSVALTAGLIGAGIALVVGFVNIVKSAISLESAQADVAKTTGLASDSINTLTDSLQDVSRATGTPTEDLLGLAAVAGSLGVEGVDNITDFVSTINALNVATDITGEEGAEQLAKFINLTKDAGQTVGESANLVGNVINALGSSLASTEKDILKMASNLGGLKVAAGLGQTDILALAGTFSSLGLNAELAGTNVTKIFIDMTTAADEGGVKLDRFASAAGLTADQFRLLVKENPTNAFLAVVEGMKSAQDRGESLNGIIKGLVGNNSEMRRVFLSSVGGIDTFRKALETAGIESKELDSLQKELDTRLNTVAGQWDLLTANVRTFGESIGRAVVPAIREGLKGVNEFVSGLSEYVLALYAGEAETDSFAAQAGLALGGFSKEAGSKLKDIGGIVLEIGKIVGSATAPIISEMATKVGDALSRAYTAIAGQGTLIGGVLEKMGAVISTVVQFIGEQFTRIPTYYKAVVDNSGQLATALEKVFRGIGQILQGVGLIVYGAVVEPFVGMVDPITKAATAVLGRIQNWAAGIGKFFQPVINLANAVGAGIADFFGMAAQATQDGVDSMITKGLGVYDAGVTEFNKSNSQLTDGLMLIDQGWNSASTGFVEGTELIRKSVVTQEAALEANAASAENLTTELANVRAEQGLGAKATQLYQEALKQFNNISNLSTDEQKNYLANLRELKAEYPALASQLNPLIVGTKDYIAAFSDGADATGDATTALETFASSAGNAEDAAKALETNTKLVNDATTLLGRGAGVSSTELFSMAMSLGDASTGTGELGAKAKDLQVALVNQAVALDTTGKALEVAKEGAEVYGERLDLVESATALLGTGSAATSDQLFAMAQSLGDASTGTGELGQKARDLQIQLVSQAVALDNQAKAQQKAAEGAEIYGERLTTVKDAQALLGSGAATTSSELFAMAVSLGDAATGSGKLGDQAKALQIALVNQGVAMDQAAAAQERALEGAEIYAERLASVEEAQHTLGLGAGATSDQLFEMALGLADASTGTGELGEKARQLQADLVLQAAAMDQATAAAEKQEVVTGIFNDLGAAFTKADGELSLYMGTITQFAQEQDTLEQKTEALQATITDLISNGWDPQGKKVTDLQNQYNMLAGQLEVVTERNNAYKDAIGEATKLQELQTGELRENSTEIDANYNELMRLAEVYPELKGYLQEYIDKAREQSELAKYIQAVSDAVGFLTQVTGSLSAAFKDIPLLAGAFDGIAAGAQRAFEIMEEGGTAAEQALAGVGAAFGAMSEALGGATSEMGVFANAASSALSALASGNALAFFGSIISGIVDMFTYAAEESKRVEDAVGEFGAEVLVANGILVLTARGYELNEEKLNEYRQGLADAEKASADFAAEQVKIAEELAKAQQAFADLNSEIAKGNVDREFALEQSRIDRAKAEGGDKVAIFISEQILAIRTANLEFHNAMKDLEAQKIELINSYLAAHPGSTRGEAEAYAEQQLGPQRDAIKEQFINDSVAILASAEEQAKSLGLSQKEFYTAVFEGNTEVLGDMTEGQRQAVIQFVEMARELGIELPKEITDAYEGIYGAQTEGGARVAEGTAASGLAMQGELDNIFVMLRNILGPDADAIIGIIQETYNKQAAAHEAGGAATAAAAGNANQDQIAQLNNVFVILRQVLGEDANAIIGLIQNTYDAQAGAHQAGGEAAANAATLAGESQRQSIANINSLLDSILGEAAGPIKEAILAAYNAQAGAHTDGNGVVGAALDGVIGTQEEQLTSIYTMLRNILGENAGPIIDMIASAAGAQADAFTAGGTETGTAAAGSGEITAQGITAGSGMVADAANAAGLLESGALDGRFTALAGSILGGDGLGTELSAQGGEIGTGIKDASGTIKSAADAAAGIESGALLARADLFSNGLSAYDGLAGDVLSSAQGLAGSFLQGGGIASTSVGQAATMEKVALEARKQALIAELQASGALPASVLSSAQALAASFGTGGGITSTGVNNAKTQELAAILARETALSAQVGGPSPLAADVANQAQQIAASFGTGAQVSIGGINQNATILTTGIRTREAALKTAVGTGAELAAQIRNADGTLSTGFVSGAQGVFNSILQSGNTISGGLGTREANVRTAIVGGYTTLSNAMVSGSGTFVSQINTAGIKEAAAQVSSSGAVLSKIRDTASQVAGGLTAGYAQQVNAQVSGSSSFTAKIQAAYNAEQNSFASASAQLQAKIQQSKGAEREKLLAEYQTLQAQHAAKSAALAQQYDSAASKEAAEIASGGKVTAGAWGSFGDIVVGGIGSSFNGIQSGLLRESGEYERLIAQRAAAAATAAKSGASTSAGGFTSSIGTLTGAIEGFFSKAGSSYTTKADAFASLIKNKQSDLVDAAKKAASAVATATKAVGYTDGPDLYNEPILYPAIEREIRYSATGYEYGDNGAGSYGAVDIPDGYTIPVSLAADSRDLDISRNLLRSTFSSLSVLRIDAGGLGAILTGAGSRFMDAANISHAAARLNETASRRNADTAARLERIVTTGGDRISAALRPGRDLTG